jgi:hypothetical protein
VSLQSMESMEACALACCYLLLGIRSRHDSFIGLMASESRMRCFLTVVLSTLLSINEPCVCEHVSQIY